MRNRLKNLNQLSVFVLLVALLCGLLASWAWAGRVRAAQDQERSDLNLFLDASSAGWAEVTGQFFTVPESAAQTVGALVGHMESTEERLVLLTETIRTSDALDAAFIGYPNGEFLFVGRSDEAAPGGFRTREISIDGDDRNVVLTWTASAREELRRENDPTDEYDPRARPWYLSPGDAAQRSWTDPYVFSSSQQPGITYSTRLLDETGEQAAVIGIDIRLSELGGFLDELAPGDNGDAMVLNVNGDIIAASTMKSPALGAPETSADAVALNMQAFAESIRRVRSDATDVDLTHTADGLQTTVTRAVRGPDDWYLTVQATDSDFLGDFSNGSLKNILGILAIGFASAIIVGALGYQVLRYQYRLKAEAERDELTGLLSRRAIRRAIDGALRKGHGTIAVAIVDLDRFKEVNDTHGHIVGDKVLAAMAARIQTFAVDRQATAGRLGGDEFAIIGSPTTDWESLVASLGEPFAVDSLSFDLAASVGVAHAWPDRQRSAEEVLREADRALFSVKRSGGSAAEVARVSLEV